MICRVCKEHEVLSRGLCRRCYKRQWRAAGGDAVERERKSSRFWKVMHPEHNKARDRAYQAAKRGKRPGPVVLPPLVKAAPIKLEPVKRAVPVRSRRRPPQLICVECGEHLRQPSPSGLCGFCIAECEEQAA